MRSAVALELVTRKVWALLDAVQPLVGSTAVTARVHPAWVRRHGLARQCRFPPRLRKGGDASVLGRLGNPSSRAGATPPSERRRGGARRLDLVARDYLADSLMPQAESACRTLTQLGLGLRNWELNSSWTPSPGGTLNRPQGTSLEGLSDWIRIIGGPPARNAGPAPTAAAYQPRRKATRMGATRTQYRPGQPTTSSPGGTSEPPGRTGLRRPRARLEPSRS